MMIKASLNGFQLRFIILYKTISDLYFAGIGYLEAHKCLTICLNQILLHITLTSYGGRKVLMTPMCACPFDIVFTFVTGWEGTAKDLRDIILLLMLDTKTCLDSSSLIMESVIICVIIEEGIDNQENKQSFSIVGTRPYKMIERCFDGLKARFPILKMMPNYRLWRQRRIPVACCILHDFIRREARQDKLFDEFQVEDLELINEEDYESINKDKM